ncbi:hypothetical protein [Pseudomonas sp.]|uniref:hypothetical protein n=1 Tax=Pseudomonas sp. TaxID=306 RepID=UPI002589D692|nr:hypothetical protein [Pseudomonas sp.]
MDDARELSVGDEIEMNGQRLRYVGDGRFVPIYEPMEKRFDFADAQPLNRPLPGGRAL